MFIFLVTSGDAINILANSASTLEAATPHFKVGGSSLTSQDFAPRDTLTLDYGAANATAHATTTFVSQPGQPILSLDHVKRHLPDNYMSCMTTTITGTNTGIMNVTFAYQDSFDLARDSWAASATFVLLTSELACYSATNSDRDPTVLSADPEQEYHAWRVGYISLSSESQKTIGSSHSILLAVEPIKLAEMVQSMRVQYEYRTTGVVNSWSRSLSSGGSRSSIPNSTFQSFALHDSEPSQLRGVRVACRNCTDLHGAVNAVITLDFTIDLAKSSESSFTMHHGALNYTYEKLSAPGLNGHGSTIEVAVGDPGFYNEIYIGPATSIFPTFKIPGLFEFSAETSMQLDLSMQALSAINFTYEAPPKTVVNMSTSISLANMGAQVEPTVEIFEWNNTSMNETTGFFQVNSGHPNLTATVSLSAFTDLSLKILDTPSTLRIIHDNSTLALSSIPRSSVTRQCSQAAPEDFETLPTAYEVRADVETKAGIQLIDQGRNQSLLNGPPNSIGWHWQLLNETHSLLFSSAEGNASCFVLSQGYPALFLATDEAVPKWDLSGIETFYLVHGTLPSNVNYRQLAQSTELPDSLRVAVLSAAAIDKTVLADEAKEGKGKKKINLKALIIGVVAGGIAFGVIPTWLLTVGCGPSCCPCSCCCPCCGLSS